VFGSFDYQFGTLYSFRPIVVAPVVGLLLGNVQIGLALGASLELLFLGSVSIGAYIPPDANSAGILCTAYAILLGLDAETAVGLAMPIGSIMVALSNLFSPVTNGLSGLAPKYAAAGQDKKIVALHWLIALVYTPVKFVVIFAAVYFGSDAVAWVLDVVPAYVLTGFSIAANMLPVLGFAMLGRMIFTKALMPFFFLGFLLTAYANIPVLGVALIALIIGIEKAGIFGPKKPALAAEGDDDDDF
jgi:fructoselysine and glucoselysine-specific PTS system IIC component